MKIVILDGYTENPGDLSWKGFESLGEVTLYDRTPKDQVVERIGDAQVVISNKILLTRQVLESCPNLRYIGLLSTGYNTVDLEAAAEHRITVTNIPTYSTNAVAQFTMALLLELCHHAGDHNAAVHRGEWQNCRDFCFWNYPLMELSGKTFGILGYGRIGQAVSLLAQAFGMQVVFFSRSRKELKPADSARQVSLEELFAVSDILSVHCPLFPETEGLINRKTITQMKDGVILLNTARGPIINEQDLAKALESGKVAAAAMDVVSAEPIQAENPLLQAKNCIITPHIAWAARETRQRLMDIAVGNLTAYLKGAPVNVVK